MIAIHTVATGFHLNVEMKHISCIDNVENLRALIRSELRDLGIKVPKHKKNKRGADKNQQVNPEVPLYVCMCLFHYTTIKLKRSCACFKPQQG